MAGLAVFAGLMRFGLPANFACMGALSIVCGFVLRGPIAWILPMATMFATDCIGHFFHTGFISFYDPWGMFFNYVGFALMIATSNGMARWLQKSSAMARLVGVTASALIGSMLFFLASNFGAWLSPSLGYEQSFSGLMNSYYMGLPFWRPTLTSDLLLSPAFYLFYGLCVQYATRLQSIKA